MRVASSIALRLATVVAGVLAHIAGRLSEEESRLEQEDIDYVRWSS
jgi:hypothetical protein